MASPALFLAIAAGLSVLPACDGKTSDPPRQHEPATLNSQGTVRSEQGIGSNRISGTSLTGVRSPGAEGHVRIGDRICCILQDIHGDFWFASNGDGLYRYDGTTCTLYTEKDGLCSNYVLTLREDQSGHLWIATRDGYCTFDGVSFTRVAEDERLRTIGLGNSFVRQRGNLWFGANGGVYGYDGSSFTFFPLPEADLTGQLEPGPVPRQHSRSTVYSILEDRAGNLWFGTESMGVCRYDGRSFTWFREKGLDRAAVRSIYQDNAGNIWFGNNGAGVCRYDGTTLTNFADERGLGNPGFLNHLQGKAGTLARVFTMTEDSAGNLWFGTIDAGAWRYDGKTLTNYTTMDGLGSDSICTIYRDTLGRLWFGTEGGGVSRYDGRSFVRVTGN